MLKILGNKAEYFFLHMNGEAFRQWDIDPGADEEVHEAAGFGYQLALDHFLRSDPKGLAQNGQHTRMTADGRRGEFLADFLRNTILQIRMSFEEADKLVINRGHAGIHFERERIPILDPTLEPGARQRAGAQIGEKW